MAFADLIVGKWNRNLFPWFTPGSRLSGCISFVSYIKPQLQCNVIDSVFVVYLSFPTSNHNQRVNRKARTELYIFRFLHQTTTTYIQYNHLLSCISFVSYIKPQRESIQLVILFVVYLSFPTSNHNSSSCGHILPVVVYLSFPTSNHNY